MGFFTALDIGSSALTAQSLRIDTISQNIANAQTTRTENGKPYKRKIVQFEERESADSFAGVLEGARSGTLGQGNVGAGVRVSKIVEDNSPLRRVYDQGHPDADKNGFVSYPNVEPIVEMINLISATRAYEANITSINSVKSMALKALEIGK